MTADCAAFWWAVYFRVFITCEDRQSYRVRRARAHMQQLKALYSF